MAQRGTVTQPPWSVCASRVSTAPTEDSADAFGPSVQVPECTGGLTEAEVAPPSSDVGSKLLDHPFDTDPRVRPVSRRIRSFPVSVRRLAPLFHASFGPTLAGAPLRFAAPSPPSGWRGDFHPKAGEHARHTKGSSSVSRRAPGTDTLVRRLYGLLLTSNFGSMAWIESMRSWTVYVALCTPMLLSSIT
jgi:hypothetical protein